jgi:hypothetical protein
MLAVHHARAEARTLPFRKRLEARWRGRGWRPRLSLGMAHLWLLAADIENLRRGWDEDRRRFHDLAETNAIGLLFEEDQSDDEIAIDTLDLTLAREALDDNASRLDSRRIAAATALAAAAALVGAILGAILGATLAS